MELNLCLELRLRLDSNLRVICFGVLCKVRVRLKMK